VAGAQSGGTWYVSRWPGVERFFEVAAQRFAWYERFPAEKRLDPLPFAHAYVMRSGRMTPERLRARSPRFAAAYEGYVRSTTGRVREERAG
jgi:hypothetical protein